MTQQTDGSPVAADVDVLIVGAGISGIGAAGHLASQRPGTTFTILEARESIGGTWDLFRYPGIRSDSDMSTFGYGFKPWTHRKAIADGHDHGGHRAGQCRHGWSAGTAGRVPPGPFRPPRRTLAGTRAGRPARLPYPRP